MGGTEDSSVKFFAALDPWATVRDQVDLGGAIQAFSHEALLVLFRDLDSTILEAAIHHLCGDVLNIWVPLGL